MNNNYFKVITVDAYSFPTEAQANFGFITQSLSFLNRGTFVVEYSFDGATVHGDLNPTDDSAGLFFDSRYEGKVWFRCVGGLNSDVRVEAWRGS